MGIAKRFRDNSSDSEYDDKLHRSSRNWKHNKKAKTGHKNVQPKRKAPYLTRPLRAHESPGFTSLGERVKLRRAQTDASVRKNSHIGQFSSLDKNDALAEQGDKEREADLSSPEDEDEDIVITRRGNERDATVDAQTDESNKDLEFTAKAIVTITERRAVRSESVVRAAEILLLLSHRDAGAARREAIFGSYAARRRSEAHMGSCKSQFTNGSNTGSEVDTASRALARTYMTRSGEFEGIANGGCKGNALEPRHRGVASMSATIADVLYTLSPFEARAKRASEARPASPSSSASAPASPFASASAETAHLARLARLARIDEEVTPRPVQQHLIAQEQERAVGETMFVFGNYRVQRSELQRVMREWVRRQMVIEGVDVGEWEIVCEFEDGEDDDDGDSVVDGTCMRCGGCA